MDIYQVLLAYACIGTFLLEVAAFYKMIQLIIEIKEGLGIDKDKEFQAGEMLKDAIVSIGLTLGEVDSKGKPTKENEELQAALANIFGFAAHIITQRMMTESGTPDISKLPKKYQGAIGLFQTFQPIIQQFIDKGGKKVVDKAVDGFDFG